jgi:hypothetical protein
MNVLIEKKEEVLNKIHPLQWCQFNLDGICDLHDMDADDFDVNLPYILLQILFETKLGGFTRQGKSFEGYSVSFEEFKKSRAVIVEIAQIELAIIKVDEILCDEPLSPKAKLFERIIILCSTKNFKYSDFKLLIENILDSELLNHENTHYLVKFNGRAREAFKGRVYMILVHFRRVYTKLGSEGHKLFYRHILHNLKDAVIDHANGKDNNTEDNWITFFRHFFQNRSELERITGNYK